MNLKWFKKYALPAILAAVVPITAQAQTPSSQYYDYNLSTNATDGVMLNYDNAGEKEVKYYLTGNSTGIDIGKTPNTTGRNSYTLGDYVNVTSAAEGTAAVAGDATGIYRFGNLGFSSTNTGAGSESNGFFWITNTVADSTFTGELYADSVKASSTATSGDVFGVTFFSSDFNNYITWGKIDGKIDIGKIEVSGANGTGLVIGSTGENADINIDEINVNNKGYAMGVEVAYHNNQGDRPADTSAISNKGDLSEGKFYVGAMNVTSANSDAIGLKADTGFNGSATSEISIGSIVASGKTSAIGIVAQDDLDNIDADIKGLTLTGDITATASDSGAAAYGVFANSANVNIEGNVTIKGNAAGAGIKTTTASGDALIANLGDGANLNVSSVDVGSGDLTVDGAGTADLGTVTQSGAAAATIRGGAQVTFAVDSAFGAGTKTVDENSSVTFVGETVSQDQLDDFSAWSNQDGSVQVKSDAGNYAFDGDGNVVRTGSNMSTGFVSAANVHQRYSTWNTVRTHMISAANFGTYRGQECDPCDPIGADPCDPCDSFSKQLKRTAWVNYIGRAEEYDDVRGNGKWKMGIDGVQAGTDLYVTRNNQLGINLGYEGGDMQHQVTADRVDAENFYLGVYGAHIFRNGWDMRGSFTYGWQSFDMIRQASGIVNPNLYSSSFDGNTSESTIEFGKVLRSGYWSLRPVFGVDVMTTDLDGATETALNSGIGTQTFGKADYTQVFLRSGAELNWQKRRLGFNSGIFYSYDVNGDNLVTTVTSTVNPASAQTLTGTELGREMLMFNVGGSYAFRNGFSVFGGYMGQAVLDTDNDAYQNVGYVGGAWKW